MNIFKKAVACLAAATVMTSMAVTASAEYSVSGDASSDDLYYITLGGFSDNLMTSISAGTECQDLAFFLDFVTIDEQGTILDTCDYNIRSVFSAADRRGSMWIIDENRKTVEYLQLTTVSDEMAIAFSADSKYLAEFMKYDTLSVTLVGYKDPKSDSEKRVYFTENGEAVNEPYTVGIQIKWNSSNSNGNSDQTSSETTSSETSSEPVSSEPVSSEPAPEPVSSEPAPEPVSSEPVSETVNSEPTASQPTNVDTGVAGIAAVVGTAVLAAGAVIVTRKKK